MVITCACTCITYGLSNQRANQSVMPTRVSKMHIFILGIPTTCTYTCRVYITCTLLLSQLMDAFNQSHESLRRNRYVYMYMYVIINGPTQVHVCCCAECSNCPALITGTCNVVATVYMTDSNCM